MAASINDGSIPYGSPTLSINSVSYITESFEVNRPTQSIPRRNGDNEPSGNVVIADFVTGTATLQKITSGTALPRQYVHRPNFKLSDKFYARLVCEKASALDRINFTTNKLRLNLGSDIIDQRWVYEVKADQAQAVLNSTAPDPNNPQWPMVNDVAVIQNVDIKTAAGLILNQNQAYRDGILRTESIRYRYSQYVLNCREIYEITAVLNDFIRETFSYY